MISLDLSKMETGTWNRTTHVSERSKRDSLPIVKGCQTCLFNQVGSPPCSITLIFRFQSFSQDLLVIIQASIKPQSNMISSFTLDQVNDTLRKHICDAVVHGLDTANKISTQTGEFEDKFQNGFVERFKEQKAAFPKLPRYYHDREY